MMVLAVSYLLLVKKNFVAMSVIDQVVLSKMPLVFTFPPNSQMVPSDLIVVML